MGARRACGRCSRRGPTGRLEREGTSRLPILQRQYQRHLRERQAQRRITSDGPWKHTLALSWLYGKSGNVVSAERLEGFLQSNYSITTRLYGFSAIHYENDEFSGFRIRRRVRSALGTNSSIPRRPAERADRPGLSQAAAGTVDQGCKRCGNSTHSGTSTASGADRERGLKLRHDFDASTKLSEKMLLESGSSDTWFESDLALQVKMREARARRGLDSAHRRRAARRSEEEDTTETLNLVFSLLGVYRSRDIQTLDPAAQRRRHRREFPRRIFASARGSSD